MFYGKPAVGVDERSSALDDWVCVGSTYYCKQKHYDLDLNILPHDFSKASKALAVIGSPLAYISVTGDNRTDIVILNAAGKHLSSVQFSSGSVLCMHWSYSENLFVFSEYGDTVVYSMGGNVLTSKILANGYKLNSCRFSTSCVATFFTLLTVHKQLFHYKYTQNNIEELYTISLKDCNLLPLCWELLFPSCETAPVLTVCHNSPFNCVVLFQGQNQFRAEIESLDENMFYIISKSFNNVYISMVSERNTLWICSYNLKRLFSKIDLTLFHQTQPTDLKWCGSGSVVCVWNTTLVMLGPENDSVIFYVNNDSYLFTCMESLVILAHDRLESIHEISRKLETLYLTAMNHGAILYEAYNAYTNNSSTAMELIDSIKDHLAEAVEDLLGAAQDECSIQKQKTLLDASLLGMTFFRPQDKDHFHKVCRVIQTLNHFRSKDIAIPLSYNEFTSYTLEEMLAILERRRLYGVSYDLCKTLGTREMLCHVISRWAIHKIESSSLSDKELEDQITEKLLAYPDIPLIDIGSIAIKNERKDLALSLLAHSSSYADQVPLLLKLNQVEKALVMSLESGNIHLVYIVILYMKKNMSISEFLLKIRSDPYLLGLSLKYYKEAKDDKMLASLYEQEDLNNYNACLNLHLCKALSPIEKITFLNKITQIAGAKSILSKISENYIFLYEAQKEIEINQNHRGACAVGDTAYETISSLIENGLLKEAESLHKKIGISQRQYQYMLIYGLAKSGSWENLKRISAEKSFVLGCSESVNACIKHQAPKDVVEALANRLRLDERCKAYLYMEMFERAADAAIASKDAGKIRSVMSQCQDKQLLARLSDAYKLFN